MAATYQSLTNEINNLKRELEKYEKASKNVEEVLRDMENIMSSFKTSESDIIESHYNENKSYWEKPLEEVKVSIRTSQSKANSTKATIDGKISSTKSKIRQKEQQRAALAKVTP